MGGGALSRGEKITVMILLAVCIAAAVIIHLIPADDPAYAVISADGEVVIRRPLSEEGEFSVPEIPNMKFEISDGGVRVTESDCPDKICIKTGRVTGENMSAVCMPNKVIVTVEGDFSEK